MAAVPSELRVPKHAVLVEVALEGRAPQLVELYLAEQRPNDFRAEDVSDLFDGPAPFLPARDVAEAETVVLRKDAIVWVAFPTSLLADGRADDLADGLAADLYDERHVVRVELRGGAGLDGEFLYSPPEGHNRVVDHLNHSGRFVKLWCNERLYLVNAAFIVRVVESGKGGVSGKD
jgi:hypothetical protein